ncbi:MAG: substrate-binding domain-containing protein [Anaerolineae bacterium]|nr:substrate-binding domain-containing protein [Anaerolineae bacterium]MCX8068434.1 substrate-binding domain-containing protein [Anaerolineae bacterium]MDW7992027.1 substrate-binding domain-containing protein [Anaerolineae bacterium]
MNKHRIWAMMSVLVGLALVLAACARPTPTPTPTVPPTKPPTPTPAPTVEPTPAYPFAGQPLKIGLLTDNSGPLAIYGPMLERGFELGLEYATGGKMEVAGRPIQVIVKDTASDPEKGVSLARELIEAEGVQILVGAPSSGVTMAVQQVALENKIILIAEPAAATDITGKNFNPYTFRTSRTNYQDAIVMGQGLLQLGKTFVQIAPDYAFGWGSACGFYAVVKAGGGTFPINDTPQGCGAVFIPFDTTDFTPYLQQVLDSKAEVLIVTWAGAGFVPLFKQMQELGIFDEMIVGTGIGDNQTLAAGYADAVGSTGIIVYHYTLPKNPVNDWLVKRHKEKYGTPPDLFTAGGMAAAIMVVEGLKRTNGDASADALIKVYEDNFSFDGPNGKYIIRPYDHVCLFPLYYVRLTNVTDPEFRFVELIREFAPEEAAPPCLLPDQYKDRCP